jgi:ribosomal-protein-alanine N-acetyltransferase
VPAARPNLRTERLDMRWLKPGDAAFMLGIWNDPAFVRYVGDRGLRTEEDARDALENGALRMYGDHGLGPYLLTLRADGTAIGICGLFHRDGLPDIDIGFALLPDYCGQGLAREAAEAVLAEARAGVGLRRLTAIVSPENAASIALIRKLGFAYEKMTRVPGDEHEVCLYGLEWPAPPVTRLEN